MNPYQSAIAWNNAEGGTNATMVTTGNSGGASGTSWTGVQRQATTVLQFTSASPVHDTLSYRFVGDSSGLANLRWDSTIVGSRTYITGVVYVNFDNIGAIATTATFMIAYFSDLDADIAYRLRITNAGTLQLANSASSTIATTSGTAMSSATTYRVEWQYNHTTGDYTIEYFLGDSVTQLASATGNNGALGASTNHVRFGVMGATTWSATFDTIAIGSAKLGARATFTPVGWVL